MSTQAHYRQDLNAYAQQAKVTLTYSEVSSGPLHATIWTVTACIDGVEHGKGVSTSKGNARELAARQAMVALKLID